MHVLNRLKGVRSPTRTASLLPKQHIESHFTGSETVRDVVIGMADGLTVPFGDSTAWDHAAETLAANPALRRRLGEAARRTAEGISWNHVIDGFERDLLEVAGISVPATGRPATVTAS